MDKVERASSIEERLVLRRNGDVLRRERATAKLRSRTSTQYLATSLKMAKYDEEGILLYWFGDL